MPRARDVQRRIDRHIAHLRSPEPAVAARAEGYLIRHYGARACDALTAACDDANPAVRCRAVWVLAQTGEARAVPTIVRLVDDPDERVRYDATAALGFLPFEAVEAVLTRLYLADDDSRPAWLALNRLGSVALPVVDEVLRGGSTTARRIATCQLTGFARETAAPHLFARLRELAEDSDPAVRAEARDGLAELGQPVGT